MVRTNKRIKIISIILSVFCILGGFFYHYRFSAVDMAGIKSNVHKDDNIQNQPSSKDELVAGVNGDPVSNNENAPQVVKNDVLVPNDKGSMAQEKSRASTNKVSIVSKLLNFGYEKRSMRNIDTVIIHSSYNALGADPYSVNGIIDEYRQYGVSAHYLIGRDGTVYQLVADKNVAYHAGISRVPDGRTGVNEFSLGIEMINTKAGEFTAEQYGALNGLLSLLKNKYDIRYVLGHNQISPGRKDDPWNFKWSSIIK